jgi:hypothetical protein
MKKRHFFPAEKLARVQNLKNPTIWSGSLRFLSFLLSISHNGQMFCHYVERGLNNGCVCASQ